MYRPSGVFAGESGFGRAFLTLFTRDRAGRQPRSLRRSRVHSPNGIAPLSIRNQTLDQFAVYFIHPCTGSEFPAFVTDPFDIYARPCRKRSSCQSAMFEQLGHAATSMSRFPLFGTVVPGLKSDMARNGVEGTTRRKYGRRNRCRIFCILVPQRGLLGAARLAPSGAHCVRSNRLRRFVEPAFRLSGVRIGCVDRHLPHDVAKFF